jgi:hypothetical protein
MDATLHRRHYLLLDHFNYMYQKMDLYTKEGWMYIAINFKTDVITGKTQFWGHAASADQ